jgi:hypothetical protein
MNAYTYSTDATSNQRLNPTTFNAEVGASALGSLVFFGIVMQNVERAGPGRYKNGTFDVRFKQALDAGQMATLDALVAAHAGTTETVRRFRTSSLVVLKSQAVSDPTGWDELGGVVTSVDYFVSEVLLASARIVGQYKTTGAGALLRVVENDGGSQRTVSPELSLPDTAGEWAFLPSFTTDKAPSVGQNLYRLQGKLNTATALSLRYVSMSLMETEP